MRIAAAALALLAYTLVVPPSLAAPSVESDATVDGTEIHQEINARGGDFH